jgi:hypothetical protein
MARNIGVAGIILISFLSARVSSGAPSVTLYGLVKFQYDDHGKKMERTSIPDCFRVVIELKTIDDRSCLITSDEPKVYNGPNGYYYQTSINSECQKNRITIQAKPNSILDWTSRPIYANCSTSDPDLSICHSPDLIITMPLDPDQATRRGLFEEADNLWKLNKNRDIALCLFFEASRGPDTVFLNDAFQFLLGEGDQFRVNKFLHQSREDTLRWDNDRKNILAQLQTRVDNTKFPHSCKPGTFPCGDHCCYPATMAPKRSYSVAKGDCLWNISGKPAVYNDPFQWPLIYDANRDQIDDKAKSSGLPKMQNDGWGHWIFPGQALNVPSNSSFEEIKSARKRSGAPAPYAPP